MSDSRRDQIDKNYQAFERVLPELIRTQAGKFALMRDGSIIAFFDTARDALIAGDKLYQDGLFSIQEVIRTPADLGFYSHAMS